MKETRNTNQRKLVLGNVLGRCDHPSAEQVFEDIHKTNPRVSRGTVYRNLKMLSETGQIRHVAMPFGPDRFDSSLGPHSHFICRECQKIIDIPSEKLLKIDPAVVPNAEIEGYSLVLEGLCKECSAKRSKHATPDSAKN